MTHKKSIMCDTCKKEEVWVSGHPYLSIDRINWIEGPNGTHFCCNECWNVDYDARKAQELEEPKALIWKS